MDGVNEYVNNGMIDWLIDWLTNSLIFSIATLFCQREKFY